MRAPSIAFLVIAGCVASAACGGGTRTAEKIFQRYFGGEPWVGREAPVVSTDDRVTQAVIARGL